MMNPLTQTVAFLPDEVTQLLLFLLPKKELRRKVLNACQFYSEAILPAMYLIYVSIKNSGVDGIRTGD